LKYIVGARGSQLSVAQTNWVITELKKVNPDSELNKAKEDQGKDKFDKAVEHYGKVWEYSKKSLDNKHCK